MVRGGGKKKLEEGAISEILVADTDSESDATASDVEGFFKEEEEERRRRRTTTAAAAAAAGLSRS